MANVKEQLLKEIEENAPFIPALNDLVKNQTEEETFPYGLSPDVYSTLSTIRNRHLISPELQKKMKESVVAFFGLSVGSHAALTWMMESRAATIKISDPDTIDGTNLNRLRTGWESVGKTKTEMVQNELHKMNPFATILASQEIDKEKVRDFIFGSPATSFIVEEIDGIAGKIWLRQWAREAKIPLISATDVGDNVIVDIERYDLPAPVEPFLGRVKNIESLNPDELSPKERMKLVIDIVGLEECSEAMLDSLLSVGQTIKTWPQLGGTATMAGGILTTVIKKILSGEDVRSGRYTVSLDATFISPEEREKKEAGRQKKIQQILDRLK